MEANCERRSTSWNRASTPECVTNKEHELSDVYIVRVEDVLEKITDRGSDLAVSRRICPPGSFRALALASRLHPLRQRHIRKQSARCPSHQGESRQAT